METGTELQPNKLYWTKNGMGDVIHFNVARRNVTVHFEYKTFDAPSCALITPKKTQTPDVWECGIARHIKDIEETKEAAKNIQY